MIIYAGIDEAGYGPRLGPLCVGCTAFSVRDGGPDGGPPDLWRALASAVCRRGRDKRHRVAVEDSKKLKGPRDAGTNALRLLERGVLAFGAARNGVPTSDQKLLGDLDAGVPDMPWYASTTTLPLAQAADELRIAGAMIRRAGESAGIRAEHLACEVIDAGEFNRQVKQMGNKATVNLCCVMRSIDALCRRWPDNDLHVMVDRLGGRIEYLRSLQVCFPETRIRVLQECETASRYTLARGGSTVSLSFMSEAEGRHLPVALASMVAKYVRELLMIRLNRFFCEQLPTLRPTAGYWADAGRYLTEVKPLFQRLRLPATMLVRQV